MYTRGGARRIGTHIIPFDELVAVLQQRGHGDRLEFDDVHALLGAGHALSEPQTGGTELFRSFRECVRRQQTFSAVRPRPTTAAVRSGGGSSGAWRNVCTT